MHATKYASAIPVLFYEPTLDKVRETGWLWFLHGQFYIPPLCPQIMPPIPVRTEAGLLRTHPTGFVEAPVTGTELLYAIQNCGVRVLKLNWGVRFKASDKPFKKFVNTLYNKRRSTKGRSSRGNFFSNYFRVMVSLPCTHRSLGVVETTIAEYLEKCHGVD